VVFSPSQQEKSAERFWAEERAQNCSQEGQDGDCSKAEVMLAVWEMWV